MSLKYHSHSCQKSSSRVLAFLVYCFIYLLTLCQRFFRMSATLQKKSIKKGALQIAGATLLSRVFAIPRVILIGRYFGARALGDAFSIAFKIPNSLRKIFADGALSAAIVPSFVNIIRNQERDQVNKLMALSFLVFETALLVLCGLAMFFAKPVVAFMAPGFSASQVGYAVPMIHKKATYLPKYNL